MKSNIRFDILLVTLTFVRIAGSYWACTSWSERFGGELYTGCCFLKKNGKGLNCLNRCFKGCISDTEQYCRPCSTNTFYEESCQHNCTCYYCENCAPIDHCAQPSATTSTLYENSDTTTLSQYLDATSNVENTDCSGLLSRDIIVYVTLSVLVMVFGIGFCLIFVKYRTLSIEKNGSIQPLPQNGPNIENSLYDIIDETGMPRYLDSAGYNILIDDQTAFPYVT